uniref:Uncharacterized protein n=1 Tax=Desertifilum tharense IPPAS B-1220 TaxID=1781255 RepID=A0ACD5GZX9_9CYAN
MGEEGIGSWELGFGEIKKRGIGSWDLGFGGKRMGETSDSALCCNSVLSSHSALSTLHSALGEALSTLETESAIALSIGIML